MHGNKDHHNHPFHPAKYVFFAVVAAAFVLLMGGVVMLLWNAILPRVLGVNPLTFWEAVGLLVLSKILFGGFGGMRKWDKSRRHGRPGRSRRAGWREKWMNMSDEERQEFKAKWKERCKK